MAKKILTFQKPVISALHGAKELNELEKRLKELGAVRRIHDIDLGKIIYYSLPVIFGENKVEMNYMGIREDYRVHVMVNCGGVFNLLNRKLKKSLQELGYTRD